MSRILIVDDEKEMRFVLKKILSNEGYEVFDAENVNDAFSLLKDNNFDLVISDIVMPEVSGINLLQSLKIVSPEVQVIMITGQPDVDSAAESVRAGAFDYLYKPIAKPDLLKVVKKALGVIEQAEERKRQERESQKRKQELEKLVEEKTRLLRKSQKFNEKVVNNSKDCICILSTVGDLLFMNANGKDAWGINDIVMYLGKKWTDFWALEDQPQALECLHLLKTRESCSFFGKLADRPWQNWEVSLNLVLEEKENTNFILAVSHEVPQVKDSADAYFKISKALDMLNEGFMVLESDGTLVCQNDAMKRVLDIKDEQQSWSNVLDVMFSFQDDGILTQIRHAVEARQEWNGQVTNDGSTFKLDIRIAEKDLPNKPTFLTITCRES